MPYIVTDYLRGTRVIARGFRFVGASVEPIGVIRDLNATANATHETESTEDDERK